MTVHFIGAGPGAADLLTLRGRDLLARCPVCLYAGSLVAPAVLEHCRKDARIVDTAPLSLDDIMAEIETAHAQGHDIARLHSGDLSVWSALAEQTRRLRALGVPYTVTPGVPSFAAAAAALERELTVPEVVQSVVLTRTSGRASKMPPAETLAAFGATGATLAVHLSIHALGRVIEELTPHYGADCPVAIVYRASWPDERILRGTLSDIEAQVEAEPIERTALILVGRALGDGDFRESALYAADYDRRFRPTGGRETAGLLHPSPLRGGAGGGPEGTAESDDALRRTAEPNSAPPPPLPSPQGGGGGDVAPGSGTFSTPAGGLNPTGGRETAGLLHPSPLRGGAGGGPEGTAESDDALRRTAEPNSAPPPPLPSPQGGGGGDVAPVSAGGLVRRGGV